jgi:opacity protein-like surface antigen
MNQKHTIRMAALTCTLLATTAVQAEEASFIGPSIALGISSVKGENKYQSSSVISKEMANYSKYVNKLDINDNFAQVKQHSPVSIDLSYGVPLSAKLVGTVGLNHDFGNYGLGSTTIAKGKGIPDTTLSSSLKKHWSVYLSPGLRIGDRWLAYAKGSYHQAQGNYSLAKMDKTTESESYTHHGLGYGVGAAFAATRNIEARMEVEQVKFNTQSNVYGSVTPKMTRANLLVGYRF